jgi:hypothetical protein
MLAHHNILTNKHPIGVLKIKKYIIPNNYLDKTTCYNPICNHMGMKQVSYQLYRKFDTVNRK